jgi:hypothetical protein
MCDQSATNLSNTRRAEPYAEDLFDAGTPFPGVFNLLKQSTEANQKVAHVLSSLG